MKAKNKNRDSFPKVKLEKKTKEKIEQMTTSSLTMDFVLKNKKLICGVKKCCVRLPKIRNGRISKIVQKARSKRNNNNNTKSKNTHDTKRGGSKSTSNDQKNKKKDTSPSTTLNDSSKKQSQRMGRIFIKLPRLNNKIGKINESQNTSKNTRKSDKKSPAKSSPASTKQQNQRKNTSSSPEKSPGKVVNRLSNTRDDLPNKKSPTVQKFGIKYLSKKLGSKYVYCHVRIKRIPTADDVPKKAKTNGKKVSFYETVEVFGESDHEYPDDSAGEMSEEENEKIMDSSMESLSRLDGEKVDSYIPEPIDTTDHDEDESNGKVDHNDTLIKMNSEPPLVTSTPNEKADTARHLIKRRQSTFLGNGDLNTAKLNKEKSTDDTETAEIRSENEDISDEIRYKTPKATKRDSPTEDVDIRYRSVEISSPVDEIPKKKNKNLRSDAADDKSVENEVSKDAANENGDGKAKVSGFLTDDDSLSGDEPVVRNATDYEAAFESLKSDPPPSVSSSVRSFSLTTGTTTVKTTMTVSARGTTPTAAERKAMISTNEISSDEDMHSAKNITPEDMDGNQGQIDDDNDEDDNGDSNGKRTPEQTSFSLNTFFKTIKSKVISDSPLSAQKMPDKGKLLQPDIDPNIDLMSIPDSELLASNPIDTSINFNLNDEEDALLREDVLGGKELAIN